MTEPTGRFVTVEGIDGAGKSTQARRLAERLRAAGLTVVETREPGGTEGAEAIRALLIGGAEARWSPETEALLFTAARRDHLERVIAPALARGDWVVCDRYVDSTRAYQGAAGGAIGLVDALHDLAVGREPDVTLLFDLEPERAAARIAARDAAGDRFEARGLLFQHRLRAAFQALSAAEPARIRLIDAAAAPDVVAEAAFAALAPLLRSSNG